MHQTLKPDWTDAPERADVAAGILDVWRIALDAENPKDARQRAGESLRDIIGGYLDLPPEQVVLKRQPGGKPYLAMADAPLEFNLSHSRGLALVAVSGGRPVGVDVEAIRELSDPLRLATRVMDGEAIAQVRNEHDPTARLRLFTDLWTRLEACQKTLGRGIFDVPVDRDGLSSFGFWLDDHRHGCVATVRSGIAPRLRFFRYPLP